MSTVFDLVENLAPQTVMRGAMTPAQATFIGNRPEHPYLPSAAAATYTGYGTGTFVYKMADLAYLQWISLLESTAPAKTGTTVSNANIDKPTGELTMATDNFRNNQIVHVTTTGSLPPELAVATPYWIVGKTAAVLLLAATQGGSAITFSGGTLEIVVEPSFVFPYSQTFSGLGGDIRTFLLREIEFHLLYRTLQSGPDRSYISPEQSYLYWAEAAIQQDWVHLAWTGGVGDVPTVVDTAGKAHSFLGDWRIVPREMRMRWRMVNAILYDGLAQFAEGSNLGGLGVAGTFGPPVGAGGTGTPPGRDIDDNVIDPSPRAPWAEFYGKDAGLDASMIIL